MVMLGTHVFSEGPITINVLEGPINCFVCCVPHERLSGEPKIPAYNMVLSPRTHFYGFMLCHLGVVRRHHFCVLRQFPLHTSHTIVPNGALRCSGAKHISDPEK